MKLEQRMIDLILPYLNVWKIISPENYLCLESRYVPWGGNKIFQRVVKIL